MPDALQLYKNKVRCRKETALADAGVSATETLDLRLTKSSIVRDVAGIQERYGPFRAREFVDVVHVAWEIEISGNVRSGGFIPWLLEHNFTLADAAERGLRVYQILPGTGGLSTFAIQVDGIEGTSTFKGCFMKRLAIDMRGRRKATYSATFACLQRVTNVSTWATTHTEGGDIMTTSGGRVSLAPDLGGNPENFEITGYEGTIEIARPDIEPAAFDADGVSRGFSNVGNWDLTGRLLIPETSGITALALATRYNGELNLRIGGRGAAGTALEIECGIAGMIDRRTGLDEDWKQCQFDFVARRSAAKPIGRVLTDQPEFV